jgi:DNA ligase-associated metallophosphoesterase
MIPQAAGPKVAWLSLASQTIPRSPACTRLPADERRGRLRRMHPMLFTSAGATLEAWPDGVLFWPTARLLAVADLHLEKGSSFAQRSARFLPPYDTRLTLDTLARAIDRLQPATVACLGDSTHDSRAAERIHESDLARLRGLVSGRRWLWLIGNHDPMPPSDWGGEVVLEHRERGLVFRHEGVFGPADGEVSGHFHPVAALSVRGRGLRRRCFVTDGRRLMMPSFGAYTGGLNALDPAIAQLFPGDYDVLALGRTTVRRLSWRQLRPDWKPLAMARA